MTQHAHDFQALAADGFEVIKGFFTPDMREDLARRGVEVAEGVKSGALKRSGQFCMGLDDAWFEPLIYHPQLIQYVASILGPDVCIVTWRIVMKDAIHFNGPINIHQDWPYFGGSVKKVNIFIPLSPVNRANGAMLFFRGSHNMGPLVRGDIDAKRYPELEEVCPEMEVGDLLCADFLTWHSSGPAQTPADRIMVQMVFQPATDPSSKHLVAGQVRNPAYCPSGFEPMREPLTQLNTGVAAEFLKAGDLDRAERFARGAFASDSSHGAAALLLHDILKARGSAEADTFLDHALKAAKALNDNIQARLPPTPAMVETANALPIVAQSRPGLRAWLRLLIARPVR